MKRQLLLRIRFSIHEAGGMVWGRGKQNRVDSPKLTHWAGVGVKHFRFDWIRYLILVDAMND
jgi:hypothetical protein